MKPKIIRSVSLESTLHSVIRLMQKGKVTDSVHRAINWKDVNRLWCLMFESSMGQICSCLCFWWSSVAVCVLCVLTSVLSPPYIFFFPVEWQKCSSKVNQSKAKQSLLVCTMQLPMSPYLSTAPDERRLCCHSWVLPLQWAKEGAFLFFSNHIPDSASWWDCWAWHWLINRANKQS